jgi:hypothetical protein
MVSAPSLLQTVHQPLQVAKLFLGNTLATGEVGDEGRERASQRVLDEPPDDAAEHVAALAGGVTEDAVPGRLRTRNPLARRRSIIVRTVERARPFGSPNRDVELADGPGPFSTISLRIWVSCSPSVPRAMPASGELQL